MQDGLGGAQDSEERRSLLQPQRSAWPGKPSVSSEPWTGCRLLEYLPLSMTLGGGGLLLCLWLIFHLVFANASTVRVCVCACLCVCVCVCACRLNEAANESLPYVGDCEPSAHWDCHQHQQSEAVDVLWCE